MYPKLNILQRFCYILRSFAHFGYEMALGGHARCSWFVAIWMENVVVQILILPSQTDLSDTMHMLLDNV